MKFYQVLSLTFLSFLNADSSSSSSKLNSATGNYAGTYEFVYHSSGGSGTACNKSAPFTVTIPDGVKNTEFRPELSGSASADPVYNSQNGFWKITELSNTNGIDNLKLNLFIKDIDEQIVCWAIASSNKVLTANLNPSVPGECPTRYVSTPTMCTPQLAFLVGQCKSGACNGDTPKSSANSTTAASGKSDARTISFSTLPAFLLGLALL